MPLPRQQVVDTVLELLHRWNTGDRDGWIAMWHEDCTIDDPVGAPTKHGLEAVHQSWDAGFSLEPWLIVPGPIIVCGNAAAFNASHMSTLGGQRVVLQDIEVWELTDDGRFNRVRAYYEPLPGTPDYFVPTAATHEAPA
jgi:steroid delta-isomerase